MSTREDKLTEENAQLREEIARLREDLVKYLLIEWARRGGRPKKATVGPRRARQLRAQERDGTFRQSGVKIEIDGMTFQGVGRLRELLRKSFPEHFAKNGGK